MASIRKNIWLPVNGFCFSIVLTDLSTKKVLKAVEAIKFIK